MDLRVGHAAGRGTAGMGLKGNERSRSGPPSFQLDQPSAYCVANPGETFALITLRLLAVAFSGWQSHFQKM